MPTTFGILDDSKLEHVPGTVILNDETSTATVNQQVAGLKHGTGRYSHIVLVPQPSDDPNDPLVRHIPSALHLLHDYIAVRQD